MIVSVLFSTFFISTFLLFYYYLNPIQPLPLPLLLLLLYLVRVLDHQAKKKSQTTCYKPTFKKNCFSIACFSDHCLLVCFTLIHTCLTELGSLYFKKERKKKLATCCCLPFPRYRSQGYLSSLSS